MLHVHIFSSKNMTLSPKVRWASGLVLGVGSIAPLVRFPWGGVLYAMLSVSAPAGPGPGVGLRPKARTHPSLQKKKKKTW